MKSPNAFFRSALTFVHFAFAIAACFAFVAVLTPANGDPSHRTEQELPDCPCEAGLLDIPKNLHISLRLLDDLGTVPESIAHDHSGRQVFA